MTTVYALWEFGEGGKYLFDVFETQDDAKAYLPNAFQEPNPWLTNIKWYPVKNPNGMKRPGSICDNKRGSFGYYIIPMEVKGRVSESESTSV